MSDLISRSTLMSRIESESRQWGDDYDAEQILGDIEDMPTAYDPDRVVEQLESKKWDIHDWRDKWRNEIIDECIEIVKGGEND